MVHRTIIHIFAMSTALLGIAGTAAAQDIMTYPMAHHPDGLTIIVTYDAALLPNVSDIPIQDICSPHTPCQNATVLVDTPVWRGTPAELSAFQDDLQALFSTVNDQVAFPQEPVLVFTTLAATEVDPAARLTYESLIFDEADAANLDINVDLPRQ